jgi:hypothetical protein
LSEQVIRHEAPGAQASWQVVFPLQVRLHGDPTGQVKLQLSLPSQLHVPLQVCCGAGPGAPDVPPSDVAPDEVPVGFGFVLPFPIVQSCVQPPASEAVAKSTAAIASMALRGRMRASIAAGTDPDSVGDRLPRDFTEEALVAIRGGGGRTRIARLGTEGAEGVPVG